MTVDEMEALFEKFAEELPWDEFKNIKDKPHNRPDIAGMIILDRLNPDTIDMVSAAEHDEIWLDADPEAVAANATEADIRLLVACGVKFFGGYFQMLV
jgi:hypothetical protein